jgi:folate-binding protein YgfZ
MFSHEEYRVLHEGAALLDRTAERGRLELRGADRRSYLHGLLTNDIAGLAAGRGCYAALLTPQGRMISDMRVSELRDRLIIDLPASASDGVRQRLADFIFSEDVEVQDMAAAAAPDAHWGLYGPAAGRLAASVLDAGANAPDVLQSLPLYGNVEGSFRDRPVILVRSDDFGIDGFEMLVDASVSSPLEKALLDAGAQRIAGDTADVTRVEAGRPAFGRDMDATTIPLEAGIEDRAISLTKGCYVGQEIIIRVLHRGQGRVAKRLVGIMGGPGEGPLLPGMRLESGGRDVGSLTSAVESPALRRPIALGYVHRDFSEPGQVLGITTGGDPIRVVSVVTTPFVSTSDAERGQTGSTG